MSTKPTCAQKFFAVLNRQLTEQGKDPIDPTDYSAPNPVPYNGTSYQGNTMVTMDPPLDSTVVGRVTVVCNRLSLTDHTGIRVNKGAANTLLELLPQISEAIGIDFTLNDFVNTAVPASGNMVIPASPSNLLYTDSLTITIMP